MLQNHSLLNLWLICLVLPVLALPNKLFLSFWNISYQLPLNPSHSVYLNIINTPYLNSWKINIVCTILFAENRDIKDPNLFEGDMILTPEQRAYAMMGLDVAAPNKQGAASRGPLWPNGVLIYDISPVLGEPFFCNILRPNQRLNQTKYSLISYQTSDFL